MLSTPASRMLLPIARTTVQKRFQSAVSGPPTQHVPKAEIAILSISILVAALAYPTYVITHIPKWRGT